MDCYELPEESVKKYIDEIFQNFGKDRNMCIEYSEFVLGTVDLTRVVERKSISNLFSEIDKDGDGYIDCSELREVIRCEGIEPKKVSRA